MQTSNTEEMVTISRAEYERLQQEKARNAKLEAKLAAREQEQAQVITSLTLQNEWLLEQLKLSKKKLFGRSSEQAEQMVMDQLSLTYNELEACVSLFSCVPISGGIIKETSRYIKKHNDTPKTSLKHFMRKVFFMFDSISPSKSFFPELLILSAKLTYL